jgi:hypothetical protein
MARRVDSTAPPADYGVVRRGTRLSGRVEMEGAHRLRNVLDALEAEILAGHVDPASDGLVNGARDTQVPGLGELL